MLFLEHVPHTLAGWLAARDAAGDEPTEGGGPPPAWIEEELARGAAFMSSRGLVHFDAHFANVLTDGRLLYFADFGLALSSGFDLSREESRFLTDHLAYDHCYTAAFLLNHHLLDAVRGAADRDAFLRDWIADRRPDGIPPETAAIIERHARTALVLNSFHRGLLTESKRTPFPAREIERARRPTAPSHRRTP